jgi:ABC-type Fe3+-hydroxamate transport system substrate-binding protein
VIRSADHATLRCLSLARGGATWSRAAGERASVAITPNAVVIASAKPDRVVAMAPASGRLLAEVRTSAKIFAVGPGGMIAVDGRDMAYLPFA